MDPPLQFLRQDAIYHAVALHSRHAAECRRDNLDAKVAFTIGPRPGMAGVTVGFVDNLQKIRGKCRSQLGLQGFSY